MIRAENYWQCFDLEYWESVGLSWTTICPDALAQAEAIEIAIAEGIYRRLTLREYPTWPWLTLIKRIYYAREDAQIIVEEENERDWPAWVGLRHELWDFCDGSKWLRGDDCRNGADDHLWDQAMERVCNKIIIGSFSYEEEGSDLMRQYLASRQ